MLIVSRVFTGAGNKRAYMYIYKRGACGSLVITFAAITLPGPRFKPRPGQTFLSRCLLHAHPMHRHRNQNWYLFGSQARTRRPGGVQVYRKNNRTTQTDYAIDTNWLRTMDR